MEKWGWVAALAAVAITACQPVQEPVEREAPIGTWRVERIGERPVMDNSPARIRFDREGRISGNASCNRFFGAYEVQEGQLVVEPLMGTTKMQCAPALMEQEARFVETLPGHYGWSVKHRILRLTNPAGDVVFRAARVE